MHSKLLALSLAGIFGLLCCPVLVSQTATNTRASQANNLGDLLKQGQALNNAGKQDEALALYQRALEMSPKSVDAHLAAGSALDLKGNYEEARRHLAQAIELASGDVKERAMRTMAVSYAFEAKASDAAEFEKPVFDGRLARQDFTGAAEAANELARIFLESGNLNDAYEWYRTGYDTALRKKDLSDTERNLWTFRWEHAQARIAARRGQGDEAQKHSAAAKTALDKTNNPDQARFFPYLTGYVAFYSGDFKSAITDLQQADQRDPFILCLLAQAYEKSGDQTQAMEYYHKVLAVNAHSPTNAFSRPLARKKVGNA